MYEAAFQTNAINAGLLVSIVLALVWPYLGKKVASWEVCSDAGACRKLTAVQSCTTSPVYDRRGLAPSSLGLHVAAKCVSGKPECVSACLRVSAHTWAS